MPKYRGGVIGLGWMCMLYDLAERPSPALEQPRFDLLDPNRPTPTLDTQRARHKPLATHGIDAGLPDGERVVAELLCGARHGGVIAWNRFVGPCHSKARAVM